MNYQSIHLGVSANDYTGDPLRIGGFKINDNFLELFQNNAFRHRHSLLVYKTLSGDPAFLTYSDLDINLIAPVIGVIGQSYEQRGERNLPFVITGDVLSAWTVPPSAVSYLYIEKNSLSGAEIFGYSQFEPVLSETAISAVSAGEHWYNPLENVMYEWDGATFIAVNRLFVASVTAVSSIENVEYIVDNDETRYIDTKVSEGVLSAFGYTDVAIDSLSTTTFNLVTSLSASSDENDAAVLLSANNYTDQVSASVTSLSTIQNIADNVSKKWAIVLG